MKRKKCRSIPKAPGFYLISLRAVAVIAGMSAFVVPTIAAIDPLTGLSYLSRSAGDIDQWKRIVLESKGPNLRKAQIKVAIQTRGPSMQGLIRIPGAPASNFDTGKGLTVVDLINAGDEVRGYTEIVALEILFTQTTVGQSYKVFKVDYGDRAQ
ncbi:MULTISPECIES: hypothetical protein [unclassified Bradyrhizobium]